MATGFHGFHGTLHKKFYKNLAIKTLLYGFYISSSETPLIK
jgi:hypothetical protein